MPAKIESRSALKRGRASERVTYSSKTRTPVIGKFGSTAASSARIAEVSEAGFETRVRTTNVMLLKGSCAAARYISGVSSRRNDRCFTLPTTPTISRMSGSASVALKPGVIRFPIAFCPGKYWLAKRSFTITTGAESIRSLWLKTRPCRTWMPMVLKYSRQRSAPARPRAGLPAAGVPANRNRSSCCFR